LPEVARGGSTHKPSFEAQDGPCYPPTKRLGRGHDFVDSELIKAILIAVVPLSIIVGIAFASSSVRRWTHDQGHTVSATGAVDTIALGGAAILMFVGVSLLSTGFIVQGFIVAGLGAPLLVYMGYYYPRILRSQIEVLTKRLAELQGELDRRTR
jgi:MFS family permease